MPAPPKRRRELWNQKTSGGVGSRSYIFVNYDSLIEVNQHILGFPAPTSGSLEVEIPYYFGELPIQQPWEVVEAGDGVYFVNVNYSNITGPETGPDIGSTGTTQTAPNHGDGSQSTLVPPEIKWSTSAGTQHITQSLKTVQKVRRGNATAARDFQKAIGVTDTGEVQGVDKYVPDIKWSIDFTLPTTAVTSQYMKKIEECVGATNLATFFGYSRGEVLMTAASLASSGLNPYWTGGFEYAVKRNKDSITLCDGLQLFGVKGWEYIWCTYEKIEENIGGNKLWRTVPREAYVEQIYEENDFNELDLSQRRPKPT